jgi:hypothetical protein
MMPRKAASLKTVPMKASKQVSSNNGKLSVTKSTNEISDVTPSLDEKPSERYAKLQPWLWLANLLSRTTESQLSSGLPAEEALGSENASAGSEPEWSQPLLIPVGGDMDVPQRAPPKSSPLERGLYEKFLVHAPRVKKGDPFTDTLAEIRSELLSARIIEPEKWLHNLAQRVADGLHFYASQRARASVSLSPTVPVQFSVDREGRASIATVNLYSDFLNALRGTEVARIQECPICQSYFYALRFSTNRLFSTKACSQRCNTTRRVREWRVKQEQYENARKLKPEGVKKERRQVKPGKERRG